MRRRPQLIIMVKEPRPGRVKTRLARDIGQTKAAWWFRHQCRRLIRRVGTDPRWDTCLAVSPDRAGLQSRIWPSHIARHPQGQGDLGQRMGRIFRSYASGPLVIIGADIPEIQTSDIEAAFEALGQHDAVLGPAPDGGYWLIGLARRGGQVPRSLFEKVRWSTEWAMQDTIQSLGPAPRIALLRSLRDIDTLADLQAYEKTGADC